VDSVDPLLCAPIHKIGRRNAVFVNPFGGVPFPNCHQPVQIREGKRAKVYARMTMDVVVLAPMPIAIGPITTAASSEFRQSVNFAWDPNDNPDCLSGKGRDMFWDCEGRI